jgi:hypothetical protein
MISSMHDYRLQRSAALLPTGKRYNPVKQTGYYADPGTQAAEIVKCVGGACYGSGLKVLTTSGRSHREIGETFTIHHDQGLNELGYFKVVGIVEPDGEVSSVPDGMVFDKNMPHWVYK